MATIQASGTQTVATIGTEYVLADLTSPFAVFQVLVDISAMLSGDTVELRAYTKILSGGVLNSALYQNFTGAPTGLGDQIAISMPIVSDIDIRFTLKQTGGATGHNFPWKVVSF